MVMEGDKLPRHFDIFLSDVSSQDLHHDVQSLLGVTYLASLEGPERVDRVSGKMFGKTKRCMLALNVRPATSKVKTPRVVIFIVDPGSPYTYLSEEVFRAFNVEAPAIDMVVLLNGRRTVVGVSPADSHFASLNVLGADAMAATNSRLTIDYVSHSLELLMGVDEASSDSAEM